MYYSINLAACITLYRVFVLLFCNFIILRYLECVKCFTSIFQLFFELSN
nr:MAG TPA: hypothetical protein [Caudoviricetes sp.]